MLLAILFDAVVACVSAFAIIYVLSFSFKWFIEASDSFIERKEDDGRS